MSGPVLALRESQYRFGLGPILVRAIEVRQQVIFDGEPWWHIRAEVANGTPESHGGWIVREIYVVGSALTPARPPTPP